jgi:tetraacyldisaccharide 4'-kinase
VAPFDPGQPVRRWLQGVAALYGLAVRVRSSWYRRGWLASSSLPRRVVSVGNITVGGTGKTPFVILLAEWLGAEGRRVAILSRGYGRTGSSFLLVSDGTGLLAGPSEAGDEPFLIARRCPRALVAVGSDRAALGRWVLNQCPVDCFLLDDGFQHRSLKRDVDLVLLDATDATGLDALLPAGRLREPLAELARATGLVITRADSEADVLAIRRRLQAIPGPIPDPAEVVFRPDSLVSVATGTTSPLDGCRGKKVWLVSGIGNSGAFRRSAESSGATVVGETVFSDHHAYTGDEVRAIAAQARAAGVELVLTTEKDAGKLGALLGPDHDWQALRIHAEIVRGEEQLRRLVLGKG